MVVVRWPPAPDGLTDGATRTDLGNELKLGFRPDGPKTSLTPPLAVHATYRAARGARGVTAVCLGPPNPIGGDKAEISWGPDDDGESESLVARCGDCEVLVTGHGVSPSSLAAFVTAVRIDTR